MWNTTDMVKPKILHESQQLQKSAEQNNMRPIWKYIANAKNSQKPQRSKQAIGKHDNALTQNKAALISRWEEWIQRQYKTQ